MPIIRDVKKSNTFAEQPSTLRTNNKEIYEGEE